MLTEEQMRRNFASLVARAGDISTGGFLEGHSWSDMLLDLGPSMTYDGKFYLGLMGAPAAKGNHHAYQGGLVEHLLQMWDTYWSLKENGILPTGDPLITDANVLKGIIVHDLHKAWATFVVDGTVDTGLNYGKHPSSSMLTNDQKSMYILNRAGVKLDLIISNVLYCSEGGWAASPPRWCSTLAKLVYLLDEWSGNVTSRIEAGTHINVREKLDLSTSFDLEFTV